ncbi:MAG TPA: MATE family efflux transporter [Elainellaceae cyanobacterium]
MRASSPFSQLAHEIRESTGLAIPLASAQLSQAATGFVDTVMLGLLGSQALASGGLGAVTFSGLLIICTSIVSAVSPLIAEAHGAGQTSRVGRVANHGLWLAVFLSVPVMLLIWNAGPLLNLLGQQRENSVLAVTYLRAIVWGFLPALAFVALKSFVTALSKPRAVMVVMVCSVILNGIANYMLMFGKLGLPALGLAGTGWASTIVYWIMFLALAVYILRQRSLKGYRVFQDVFYFNASLFWEIVRIGWPIGVLAAFETGMFTITTFLAGQMGTTTLAAHQIALQTASVTFMVPLGISQAVTVRVGWLIGQKNPEGARLAGSVGIALGAIFMGIMAVLMWAFPNSIIAVYLDIQNPQNQPVMAIAAALLGVAAIFQIFDGIQVIAAGALRGLKDTRIPMVIGIISYWLVGFSSSFILGIVLGWGGVGLWFGLAFGLLVAATVLTWRFWGLITPAVKMQESWKY